MSFKKMLLLLSILAEWHINKTIYRAYPDIARRSEKPTRSARAFMILLDIVYLECVPVEYLYPYLNYLTSTWNARQILDTDARKLCERETRMSKA